MRISDWSSDVCSSDLEPRDGIGLAVRADKGGRSIGAVGDATPRINLIGHVQQLLLDSRVLVELALRLSRLIRIGRLGRFHEGSLYNYPCAASRVVSNRKPAGLFAQPDLHNKKGSASLRERGCKSF